MIDSSKKGNCFCYSIPVIVMMIPGEWGIYEFWQRIPQDSMWGTVKTLQQWCHISYLT
jgi:hypothetical protein